KRADKSAVFNTGHITGVRAGVIATRPEILVELDEGTRFDHLVAQVVVFFLRAIDPMDGCGLGEGGHLVNPGEEVRVYAQGLSRGSGNCLHVQLFSHRARETGCGKPRRLSSILLPNGAAERPAHVTSAGRADGSNWR